MEHNIQQSLFFDIETTGLSADISAITVIGCCDMDGNVTQWFNEDGLSQNTPAAFQGFSPGTPLNTAGGRRGSFPFWLLRFPPAFAGFPARSALQAVSLRSQTCRYN